MEKDVQVYVCINIYQKIDSVYFLIEFLKWKSDFMVQNQEYGNVIKCQKIFYVARQHLNVFKSTGSYYLYTNYLSPPSFDSIWF